MPYITKITVQKANKDRYNIFTDDGNDENYAFSVDADILIKFQLKKGLELDEFSISEICYQDEIRKAYNMAIQYLSRRMRAESEVRTYLESKEIGENITEEVIHKLYQYHFLDDAEFAAAFVRTQMNTTDKGSGQIAIELRNKGISEEMISEALTEYPKEAELHTAIKLCEKYAHKNVHDSSRVLKQKLEQMLLRKGFDKGIIQDALAESEMDKNEDDEMSALRVQALKATRKYAGLDSYDHRQKVKQFLFRKGFSIDLIEEYLSEEKD